MPFLSAFYLSRNSNSALEGKPVLQASVPSAGYGPSLSYPITHLIAFLFVRVHALHSLADTKHDTHDMTWR